MTLDEARSFFDDLRINRERARRRRTFGLVVLAAMALGLLLLPLTAIAGAEPITSWQARPAVVWVASPVEATFVDAAAGEALPPADDGGALFTGAELEQLSQAAASVVEGLQRGNVWLVVMALASALALAGPRALARLVPKTAPALSNPHVVRWLPIGTALLTGLATVAKSGPLTLPAVLVVLMGVAKLALGAGAKAAQMANAERAGAEASAAVASKPDAVDLLSKGPQP